MQRSVWLLLALGLISGIGWAQPAAGLPPERAARIDRLLQQYVDKEQIAGAVALVLRDGKPVYEKAVGWSDKEAGRKMTSGTLFRIASQSKAVTSAAIMALVEDGKVGINEPVGNFIASFKKTMVAEKEDNGGARMVPARRPITAASWISSTASPIPKLPQRSPARF